MTKKLPPTVKQQRRPTSVACSFCHSKHLQCDSQRPCKNCIKRGIADTCTDAIRKKKSIKKRDHESTISGGDNTTSDDISEVNSRKGSDVPTDPALLGIGIGIGIGIGTGMGTGMGSSGVNSAMSTPTITTTTTTGGSVNYPVNHAVHGQRNDSTPEITTRINNIHEETKDNDKDKDKDEYNSSANTNANANVNINVNDDAKTRKRGRPSKTEGAKSEPNTTSKRGKVNRRKRDNSGNGIVNGEDTRDEDGNDNQQDSPASKLKKLNNGIVSPINQNQRIGISTGFTAPTILPPPPPIQSGSGSVAGHLPLLNLANVSLSAQSASTNASASASASASAAAAAALVQNKVDERMPLASSLSDLRLPSFSDLKSPLYSGFSDMRLSQLDMMKGHSPLISEIKAVEMTPVTGVATETAPVTIKASATGTDNGTETVPDTGTGLSMLNIPGLSAAQLQLQYHSDHHRPDTPGSPLEFSVTNSTRANTIDHPSAVAMTASHSQHDIDSRFNSQGMVSSNSSVRHFQSTVANEEYVKLTDLLNTDPPSPTVGFLNNNQRIPDLSIRGQNPETNTDGNANGKENSKPVADDDPTADPSEFLPGISPSSLTIDDDDTDTRPYITLNLEDGTMISSYPNNSTPNSYVYNAEHSQIPNTAREMPMDLQQDEDYTSPLIMRHVIKQPDDIYLTSIVKAYQYPKAYHALIAYLKRRFSKLQLLEIAKCMAKYRPSFISATKNLYENDLIFTERSFQRTLLEYENLISMAPSPTIIWRRTGEIVALTNEFAMMTGYSRMSLLSKRTFIMELMDDESTINYFRSFSNFAFGDLNATYLTDCNLRKAEDNNYLRCCCVWTIKRDVFDIPMLIVGQFLPVLE